MVVVGFRDVLNEFVKKRQLLVTLPNTIHKREADEALRLRTDFLNQNSLQYIDCFFFSLLLKLPYDKDVWLAGFTLVILFITTHLLKYHIFTVCF